MSGVELGKGLLQLLLLLSSGRVQETVSPAFLVVTFERTLADVILVLQVVVVVVVEAVGGQGGQKVETS